MSMVDEDGLCRLTELTPEQCGCRHHRGKGLGGMDEAIIDSLVGGQPGQAYLTPGMGWSKAAHDDELKDNGRLGDR